VSGLFMKKRHLTDCQKRCNSARNPPGRYQAYGHSSAAFADGRRIGSTEYVLRARRGVRESTGSGVP
jgi:hypothetical protein